MSDHKSPAFQFYPGDWLASTRIGLMTPAQEGAYIRLLCYAWRNEDCSLPDDDQVLSKLSRLNEGWFDGSGRVVRECFVSHDGRLFNHRLIEERNKQTLWKEKSKQGGILSGKARREKSYATKCGSTSETKGGCLLVEPNVNSSSSSSSSLNTTTRRDSPPYPLSQNRGEGSTPTAPVAGTAMRAVAGLGEPPPISSGVANTSPAQMSQDLGGGALASAPVDGKGHPNVPADFAERFEALYRAHPQRGKRQIAQQYLVDVLTRGSTAMEEIERVHGLWLMAEGWKRGFAPSLANWLQDEGWRYEPGPPIEPPKTKLQLQMERIYGTETR